MQRIFKEIKSHDKGRTNMYLLFMLFIKLCSILKIPHIKEKTQLKYLQIYFYMSDTQVLKCIPTIHNIYELNNYTA